MKQLKLHKVIRDKLFSRLRQLLLIFFLYLNIRKTSKISIEKLVPNINHIYILKTT